MISLQLTFISIGTRLVTDLHYDLFIYLFFSIYQMCTNMQRSGPRLTVEGILKL